MLNAASVDIQHRSGVEGNDSADDLVDSREKSSAAWPRHRESRDTRGKFFVWVGEVNTKEPHTQTLKPFFEEATREIFECAVKVIGDRKFYLPQRQSRIGCSISS